MHTLNILYNTQKVGKLLYDDHSKEFKLIYDNQWIKTGFEISPMLNFSHNFDSTDIKNFIENLLPEGDGLDKLIQYLHISQTNKFALLKAIGDETSGALSFVSDEQINQKTTFREISPQELAERIKQRKQTPITIWDERPRLSVAGVQEKLPICKIGDKYGFGEGELSSTHILKFDKANQNLVLNEYFCLQLAKIAGLSIPPIKILQFDDELVLEVERFDRKIISNNKIEKIHIIDSCQALGVPASFKYERNFGTSRDVKDIREGVSLQKLNTLSNDTKVPVIVKKTILDWTIVNLILGNSDAHGKNISFFIDDSGLSLTPFYDIVNISLYKNIYETSLAMAIDDEFEIDKLSAFDIAAHCYGLGLTPKTFVSSYKIISKKILNTLEKKTHKEISKYDVNFANLFVQDILHRIKKLNIIIENSLDFKKQDI